MLSRVRRVNANVTALDRQRAAPGHGIAGVDREIEEDLVKFAGIGVDVPQRALDLRLDTDLLGQGGSEKLDRGGDDVIHVHHPRLEDLLPRRSQELLREVAVLLRRGADVADELTAL